MSSEIGTRLHLSLFGESHGPAVGMVLDGLPAGEAIDADELDRFLARRRGGKAGTTPRVEADKPNFLSGLTDGVTNGAPLCVCFPNENVRREEYSDLNAPRPGHADLTAFLKWKGHSDLSGGGHLSGRLTAPMCAAGGIALQILKRRGIHVGSHLLECAGISDRRFSLQPTEEELAAPASAWPPCLDTQAGCQIMERLSTLNGNSAGGIVECAVTGLPAGLGSPIFDGAENRIARALFGIPAVKGVEFGLGFDAAKDIGSRTNDAILPGGTTETNHCGGILGGITNGMPLVVTCAFKPTPSISLPQNSVSYDGSHAETVIANGRHDPCVALRGAAAVEAMTAFCCLDMLLEGI